LSSLWLISRLYGVLIFYTVQHTAAIWIQTVLQLYGVEFDVPLRVGLRRTEVTAF
jgi:hypothetical protein